jgi:hypothetical protein
MPGGFNPAHEPFLERRRASAAGRAVAGEPEAAFVEVPDAAGALAGYDEC